jgi:hypothetical protein
MKSRTALVAILVVAGLVVTIGLALAQQRKAGDHLVYIIQATGQGGSMAAGRNGSMTINLAIDRVNADASAHAVASLQAGGVPPGQGLSFEATISPAGAILPKYDPNFKPKVGITGMSSEDSMKMASNTMAKGMQQLFVNFNAFAEASAQRTLRVGESWRAPGQAPEPIDIIYTVTGRQTQQGHDSFVVSMQGAPNSQGSLSGQAYYDPSAHLVIGYHYELKSLSNGESLVTDISLQP